MPFDIGSAKQWELIAVCMLLGSILGAAAISMWYQYQVSKPRREAERQMLIEFNRKWREQERLIEQTKQELRLGDLLTVFPPEAERSVSRLRPHFHSRPPDIGRTEDSPNETE